MKMTNVELDRYLSLNDQIKILSNELETIKEKIKEVGDTETSKFMVRINEFDTTRIKNSEGLIKEFGANRLKNYISISTTKRIEVLRKS